MKPDEELLFRASVPAFLLSKLCWYADDHFRGLERRPPDVPVVSYQLARDDGTVTIPAPQASSAPPRIRKATARSSALGPSAAAAP